MSDLAPRAFDIETSGLGADDVITVAGIASDVGAQLILNTAGRPADASELEAAIADEASLPTKVTVTATEAELLAELHVLATSHLEDGRHYLTAYNGETWNGGFDLPFLRSACARHDVVWPFGHLPYVDAFEVIQRFEIGDDTDLVSAYDTLIGEDHCDPFTDSEAAVHAFEDGSWTKLLLHNLADITRTYELMGLASRYVPQSDFSMKSLAPPMKQ